MTQRDEIIAKLRDYEWCVAKQRGKYGRFDWEELSEAEISRIIADLEFAAFAHERLEHIEGKPALLRRKGDRKP